MSGMTVFVTGAGRGVGAALARALSRRGEQVFAGLSPRDFQAAKAGGFAEAGDTIPLCVDVTDESAVLAAAHMAGARTRHVDVILNVAGVLGDIKETVPGHLDYADMHRVYDVNSLGPLRVTNAFFPLLLAGQTRLVLCISSEAGSIGTCTREGWYAYCMSKAALNMACAILHNNLRPLGGAVVVIHPGWVRTWMQGKLDEAADLSPDQSAQGILRQLDRALQGEEIFRAERPAFIDWAGKPLPW